jgi:hypothetical protein
MILIINAEGKLPKSQEIAITAKFNRVPRYSRKTKTYSLEVQAGGWNKFGRNIAYKMQSLKNEVDFNEFMICNEKSEEVEMYKKSTRPYKVVSASRVA